MLVAGNHSRARWRLWCAMAYFSEGLSVSAQSPLIFALAANFANSAASFLSHKFICSFRQTRWELMKAIEDPVTPGLLLTMALVKAI